MQNSSRARSGAHILSMLEHSPLHQELRLGRGNRDILYMLEHRPLHQDVRRNTGRERASGHLSCTCWGIGPCIRMSGAKTPRGCASRVALHRNDDAPNAAKAAGGGGVAAGAGDEEAAGADDGAAAGAGTVKTLGAPPAAGAGGPGGVGVAPALGNAPPTARCVSHATSSAGFAGRRSWVALLLLPGPKDPSRFASKERLKRRLSGLGISVFAPRSPAGGRRCR